MKCTLKSGFALLGVLTVDTQAAPPITAELVGRWNTFQGFYADIWGDGNYAYLCHFGHPGVDVIDIADPFHPAVVATIMPNPPNHHASAQDVQVGDGLLFIALESDGFDGVLIVDVRDPMNPIQRTVVTIPGFSDVHNVFYDSPILYLANSRTPQVGIVDLAGYNPDTAPARITEALWTLNGVGSSFVHDITVQNGRLFACAWNSGIRIYDVSGVRRRVPTFVTSGQGIATHSCWATDDGRFLVTGEERPGGGVKVFEYQPPSPISQGALLPRGEHVLPLNQAYCVHNQLIRGNRLFDAWYQAGLLVHDINPVTGALTLVTEFDTYEDKVVGFNGAWGVYPFLGDDRILVSDIANGLFVLDVSGVPKIHVDDLPVAANPVVPTPISIRVLHERQLAKEHPVTLHLALGGRGFEAIPMSRRDPGMYAAELPPVPCGMTARFYFSAVKQVGGVTFDPTDAPEAVYSLLSLTQYEERLHHDSESASGWTGGVSGDNASSGVWTRGNPVGTIAQPENDNPLSTGSACWFTGQGPQEGIPNLADVDGGKTTLLSPMFDGTGLNTFIGYARWYSNDLGPNAGSDTLAVSISNDNGANWLPLEVLTGGPTGWTEVAFPVAELVAPSATMRLRVVASDTGGDSLIEAGIDDFRLFGGTCIEIAGDVNGDGAVNLNDIQGLPPCLGGPDIPIPAICRRYNLDQDNDVDLHEWAIIQENFGASP